MPRSPHPRHSLADNASTAAAADGRGPVARWALAGAWVVLTCAIIAAMGGDMTPTIFQTFVFAVFLVPLFVPAWMAGLLLTGPFARRGCFAASPWPAGWESLVATALGLGAFALATLLMGSVHLIEPAGSPWPLLVIPAFAAAVGVLPARRFLRSFDGGFFSRRAHRGEWLLLLAAVPAAMLLISATFPPLTLWGTEAHGYDVMEYHLELPREYAQNNSTAPVAHNVYSFFPGNVEMLYLFLQQFTKGAMQGDRDTGYVWGALPSQFCHAALMLLAAAALALVPLGPSRDAASAGGPGSGGGGGARVAGRAVAVIAFLGVPWTLITGSLAYNEGGMLFFGVLALGLALGKQRHFTAAGVLIGLLLGLAVGCKMTAGVFFALPVAAVLLGRGILDRGALRAILPAVLVALAVYAPWAVRAAVYSRGNPVFPIASGWLGRNDWTPEQSERFNRGHGAPAALRPISRRLQALIDSSVFDANWSVQPYGLLHITDKPAPAPAAPAPPGSPSAWKRVGLLWLALPLALAAALISRRGRWLLVPLGLVLLVQLAAWLFATHLQSRFLLPLAVPLALILGAGVTGAGSGAPQRVEGIGLSALRIAAAVLVALHALCTGFILLPEAGLLGGIVGAGAEAARSPALYIGKPFAVLENVQQTVEHPQTVGLIDEPITTTTLLLGDATAWRFSGPVKYFTVFDTDPFLELLRRGDAQKCLAWLQERGIGYVWIDWSEVDRLRRTYDFDPPPSALTPAAIFSLQSVGIADTGVHPRAEVTILRVPRAQ